MFFTQFRKRKRGLAKAKAYGVKSVPAVAINGKEEDGKIFRLIEHLQDDHPKAYVDGCDLGWC